MVSKKVCHHSGNRRRFCDSCGEGGSPHGREHGSDHLSNDINGQKLQAGGVLVSTYGLTATSTILGRSCETSVPAQRVSGLAKWGCSEVRRYRWETRRIVIGRSRQTGSLIVGRNGYE